MVKPGIRSTEFWVSALADLGMFTSALAGVLPAKYAAVLIAADRAAYALSRGLAKHGKDGGS